MATTLERRLETLKFCSDGNGQLHSLMVLAMATKVISAVIVRLTTTHVMTDTEQGIWIPKDEEKRAIHVIKKHSSAKEQ